MNDEAERVPRVPFPAGPPHPAARQALPARVPPRPTGTLEEILARIEAEAPPSRLATDLDRIERALSRLEQAMREALEDDQR
ncbi:hypothetical protein [Falsiroseomonas sp. CW058]|uniref:hypothetical protein n=1 Tax=Falsiroseomonas sp. CW058 TaxID=3388664 RepID=UPI003D3124E3